MKTIRNIYIYSRSRLGITLLSARCSKRIILLLPTHVPRSSTIYKTTSTPVLINKLKRVLDRLTRFLILSRTVFVFTREYLYAYKYCIGFYKFFSIEYMKSFLFRISQFTHSDFDVKF